jgi:hypothetical protein
VRTTKDPYLFFECSIGFGACSGLALTILLSCLHCVHRAKTSTGDVTGDVEERRVSAKQLLLDLERKLGPEKLAEVANAIKRWHQESIPELQVFLVEVLRGQTELLERFLDFLPKRRL